MLRYLAISNFVLIEHCQLEFGNGLCVFTGETGAGKSILLDALGLILGARLTSRQLLRDSTKPATLVAEFSVNPETKTILHDAGIEVDDSLILKRVLLPDNASSRCLLNDQPISLNLLKSLGEKLVEIHGQHGQRDLTDMAMHRHMLDDFATLQESRKNVSIAFTEWEQTKQALEELEAQIAEAKREEEYLRHVAEELSLIQLQENEEDELAAERAKLMKAEQLGGLLQEAMQELNASHTLHQVQRLLLRSDASQMKELQPIIEGLERAQIEVTEVSRQLDHLSDEFGHDPDKLEVVEERLFALRAAARKHQVNVAELPALLARILAALTTLNSQESLLQQRRKQNTEARAKYLALAEALSVERHHAATNLATDVMAELAALKMAATRFHAKIERLPETGWNISGIDRVCFEVSTNPGSPFGALHKIASGGELSRFMLALKVVLAKTKHDTTLIFDEIDAGTSGIVADAIGERLARLGKQQQVMVITHLPQVASKGQSHFKVAKTQADKSTHTTVVPLGDIARQEELAQMLSGKEITPEARHAAARLMGNGTSSAY
jgi:DNA repair protein RecN (Recombination protein N)